MFLMHVRDSSVSYVRLYKRLAPYQAQTSATRLLTACHFYRLFTYRCHPTDARDATFTSAFTIY